MVAQSIEQLKNDWTDKYVVVDGERPELARFRDVVGVVKTVNMSGRALVEFMDYHVNIGWYDIDLSFLTQVDKPEPAVKGEKKAAKPAAKAPAAAAAAPAAKAKPAAAGKASVADILAAARAGKAPAKPAAEGEAAAAPAKAAPAAKPATKPAAKPAAAPAGKVDRSKMSVADMIAMAKGGAGAAKAAPAEAAPAEEEAPAEVEAAPVPAKAKAAPAASSEKIDKSKMSIDDMCNWCRAHDTK